MSRKEPMDKIAAFHYLALAVQRESGRMLGEALRPLGLTPAQSEVLEALSGSRPISLGELGSRLLCETGSPSRLVDRLVGAGLVERRPSLKDKRAVVLGLTAAGRETARLAAEAMEGHWAALEALLEDAPLEDINRHLWRMAGQTPSGRALRWRQGREVTRGG